MTHADLVQVAARWLRHTRRCGVVLTEHHGGTVEVPDAIGWRGGFLSIQVECKVSLADFRADQRKSCRRRDIGGLFRQAQERWYLAPAGLIAPDTVPDDWGLLEWDGRRVVRVKPAGVCEPNADIYEQTVTRLYMELRRYQAQGIRYKTIAELQAAEGGQG